MTEEEILAQFEAAYNAGGEQPSPQATPMATAVDPRSKALREYAEKAGTGRALASGLAEGATFGFANEIQALIDQLTGASEEPGYLTPEQRTEILKQKAPGAYMGGDIAASLATGLIPVAGPALRGAGLAKGAARVGTQAALGALEGAGRAASGERLEGAGTGAFFGAAGGAGGEALSALVDARRAARTAKATEKAEKMTSGKAVSAIDKKISTIQDKLIDLSGKSYAEKSTAAIKLDDDILKLQAEVDRLRSQGVVPGIDKLDEELASAKQQLKLATKEVESRQKSVFDVEEELARLAEREPMVAARSIGKEGAKPIEDLATKRRENLAVLELRQKRLQGSQAGQSLAQKAVDDYMMRRAAAMSGAKQMPAELPATEQRLQKLLLQKQSPPLTPSELRQKSLQDMLSNEQVLRDAAMELFNKDVNQLTKQEAGMLMQAIESATKFAAPAVSGAIRTTGAR